MPSVVNKTFDELQPGDTAGVQRTVQAADLRAWACAFGDPDLLAGADESQGTAGIVTAIAARLCSRPESASIRPPCGRASAAPWAGSAGPGRDGEHRQGPAHRDRGQPGAGVGHPCRLRANDRAAHPGLGAAPVRARPGPGACGCGQGGLERGDAHRTVTFPMAIRNGAGPARGVSMQ